MVQRFASWPHPTHLVTPGSIFGQHGWSKGMQGDFAPADGARSSVRPDFAADLQSKLVGSEMSEGGKGGVTHS